MLECTQDSARGKHSKEPLIEIPVPKEIILIGMLCITYHNL